MAGQAAGGVVLYPSLDACRPTTFKDYVMMLYFTPIVSDGWPVAPTQMYVALPGNTFETYHKVAVKHFIAWYADAGYALSVPLRFNVVVVDNTDVMW
jgi:hypothetical protein